MFMLIGVAEKAGSGVDKIRRGWASQHWRSPMIREQFQPDRVSWRLPMHSLIPDDSLARLKDLIGTTLDDFNKDEIQALVTADLEGIVDNARLREICLLHTTDVTRLLQGLVAKGVLTQEGQGRWTRYRLANTKKSQYNGVVSKHKEEVSEHKPDSSEHKPDSSEHNDELLAIAEPVRSKHRVKPDRMEQILLELCRKRWLTRNQLASLIDRHPDGLRQRFLNPMVTHGLLKLRYPNKPNRADQAYTAVIPPE